MGERIYEGKAKIVYRGDEPGVYLMEFKDDATAFNGLKKGSITDKGVVNARLTARLFRLLEEAGIPTQLLATVGERVLKVRELAMVPVEVVVRNVAAGSLCKRLGLEKGREFSPPLLELYLKDDSLGDPLVNRHHLRILGKGDDATLDQMEELAGRINEVLRPFFRERGLELVDFKLEFGRTGDGEIVLGDEITPDTCRLWDAATRESLDKDRFRQDLGGVEEAYAEVARRVMDE